MERICHPSTLFALRLAAGHKIGGFIGVTLAIIGFLVFVFGCSDLLKAKGYDSGLIVAFLAFALCCSPFIFLAPLIIIFGLKDKTQQRDRMTRPNTSLTKSTKNHLADRGTSLTFYLIFASVFCVFSIILYIADWDRMAARMPTWGLYTLRAIVALRPISILAIWLWSRSGVVLYILLSLTSIFVGAALGINAAISGTLGMIIITAIAWPNWRYMTWGISLSPKRRSSRRS